MESKLTVKILPIPYDSFTWCKKCGELFDDYDEKGEFHYHCCKCDYPCVCRHDTIYDDLRETTKNYECNCKSNESLKKTTRENLLIEKDNEYVEYEINAIKMSLSVKKEEMIKEIWMKELIVMIEQEHDKKIKKFLENILNEAN
jgi:hypothetical protein